MPMGNEGFVGYLLLITDLGITLPDIAFSLLISLIIMKRSDLIRFVLKSVNRFTLSVVALLAMMKLAEITVKNMWVPRLIIEMAGISALLVFLFGIDHWKKLLVFFLSSASSVLMVICVHVLLMPIVLYGAGITADEAMRIEYSKVILSLPGWSILAVLIAFTLLRNNGFMRVNPFKLVSLSNHLRIITLAVAAVHFMLLCMFVRFIFIDRVLASLQPAQQLIILSVGLVFPVVNMFVFLLVMYYLKDREAFERFNIQEDLKVSIADIRFFLKRGEYHRIANELKYLEHDASMLYKDII